MLLGLGDEHKGNYQAETSLRGSSCASRLRLYQDPLAAHEPGRPSVCSSLGGNGVYQRVCISRIPQAGAWVQRLESKENRHLPGVPLRTLARKPQDSRFLEGIKSKEEREKKPNDGEGPLEQGGQLASWVC